MAEPQAAEDGGRDAGWLSGSRDLDTRTGEQEIVGFQVLLSGFAVHTWPNKALDHQLMTRLRI
jgi:hypothetical protein